MNSHNIGFYEKISKIILNYNQISPNMHLISSSADAEVVEQQDLCQKYMPILGRKM